MHAYLFWYRRSEYEPTTYCYVIAVSYKQARFYWFRYLKNVVGYCVDYSAGFSDQIDEIDFVKPHKDGDILGQDATI